MTPKTRLIDALLDGLPPEYIRAFTATCRQPVTCAQEAQRESAYYIPHQCQRCGWHYRKVKGNEDEQK